MPADKLDENTRAEDILLGSLGYGECAVIVHVHKTVKGYKGTGRFEDGEIFDFESEDEPGELELWALKVLAGRTKA